MTTSLLIACCRTVVHWQIAECIDHWHKGPNIAAGSPAGRCCRLQGRRQCIVKAEHRGNAVVVGGGWAGFGAAYALLEAGAQVTLVDAADSPGGLSAGWRTTQGRVVEAGIKGFWHQYRNIDALIARLGISNPFTDWTCSSFYAPDGLQCEAPILKHRPRLPTPLGSLLWTSPYFTKLPVSDRLTALPLIGPLLEFEASEEAYRRYDTMTAAQLFVRAGISQRLYREFLEPMLLVTLFAPPHMLSAAAALAALQYFALAHQADFDVRWCRGSVAERLLQPFVQHLERQGGRILGGRRVQQVQLGSTGRLHRVITSTGPGHQPETLQADSVVFAVGVKGMQAIVESSQCLAASQGKLLSRLQEFRNVQDLTTIDAAAVRLWLDRRIVPQNPSNVMARFQPDVGGTFFDLNTLQDQYAHEPGSVVEVDFYNTAFGSMSDDLVVQQALHGLLAGCLPAYGTCHVTDASVLRFPGAVTAFSPGSHDLMPRSYTSFPNAFIAADWVAQGPGTHGAKGLSQEKALVSGITAGNQAARELGFQPRVPVLPVEQDEPHMAAGKYVMQGLHAATGLANLTFMG